ncbi:phage tail tape measure C-terminal domain-containing protein [Salibaculum griseiflavum]|uniref:Phage tail tape-measure protein n=1 Tax=Salibaculum griseiflavum TaxID=1914409 RepID=A0A2V1P3Z1_9RHOB|nr:phage tail tape measure C-terminal domain-containing protein [Salibaculum griseiflavum]PWG16137.1 phage tail tape-measure protein [Salibaculum griseiflavum]
MATKQVSVRLFATGGRQVRAELEGVGKAGSKGMGPLSREMDAANKRMAAFARRAKLMAATAAAAVTAAGVSMVRMGLQTVDAQAKLAQSLDTTVASVQVLERAGALAGVAMSGIEQATKDLTRRLSQAAAGGGPAAAALDRLGLSAGALMALPLDARVAAINDAITAFVPAAERAVVAGQLFGEEGSIAMARIDSATLRQATKDLADFGVVASEQDANQIERTNDALSRLGLIWRGLSNQLAVAAAPALEGIADALVTAARVTGPLGQAIQGLIGNLDRIVTYAGTFAGLMAGKWVAGMTVAALSVKGLATALVVLRGALLRTGIGALVVGAGELVYWFTTLVSGAGSFGDAMGLLRDVASDVWSKVALSAEAAWTDVKSDWAAAQAAILDGLQIASDRVVDWANSVLNTFEGTFLAVKSIWEALPDVFGRIGVLAINGLVEAMETGLEGLTSAVNSLLTLGGRRPDWAIAAPDLSEWKKTVPEAVDLGNAARTAYDEAFTDSPLTAPDLFGDMAGGARLRSLGYAEAARMLRDAASGPLASWRALNEAVTGSGQEGAAALDEAAASADRVTEALSQASGAAGSLASAVKPEEQLSGFDRVRDSLQSYAKTAMDWGKGLGATLTKAFSGAESAFRSFVETGKLDFKGLVRSILADLAVLAFRRAVLGPIANALGGVFGGGTTPAAVSHNGGIVGLSGMSRSVPRAVFAGAPRMHGGGWPGLRPDEVPTILQRGERVLNRREAADYVPGGGSGTGVSIAIDARGAQMGVAEQIDQKLRAALPEIKRVAIQSVRERRQRGHAV